MMYKRLFIAAWIVLHSGALLFAFPPTLVLSGRGTGGLDALEGAAAQGYAEITGRFYVGTRVGIGDDGFLALSGDLLGIYELSPESSLSDAESLGVSAGIPLGEGRITAEAGLRAAADDPVDGGYRLVPSWGVRYRAGNRARALRPYLASSGSYVISETSDDDGLMQSVGAGVEFTPGVITAYDVGLEAVYRNWTDIPVLLSSGAPSAETRRDLAAYLMAEATGLFGYFTDWQVTGRAGFRTSTANRYIAAQSYLEDRSEDRVETNVTAAVGYSPVREISVSFRSGFSLDYYLYREVLSEGGMRTGDLLTVSSVSASARLDWEIGRQLFLVAEGGGQWDFSADAAERGWAASISAGLDYTF